jgi:HAD superfamily hydrolase (TIGR01484 family)
MQASPGAVYCYHTIMKNQAIIFDIDGTAIDSPTQKLPTNRLVKAIRGVETKYCLCAATGRVWSFAKPILKGLSLVDPCIISAGTQICDPSTGKIIWQCDIEPDALAAVIRVVKKYPGIRVLFNDYDESAYLKQEGWELNGLVINEPVYFFEPVFVPEKIAPEIAAKLSEINGIACTMAVAQKPGFNDLHITNGNATKEHSVAELLKLIDVKRENTTGVGDGHNDIHLFNAVSHKVAMGNAVKELKDTADEKIGDVADEGFAKFLESLAY